MFRVSKLLAVRFVFFFFKQKTAYEVIAGDWSSDVCSSDLSRLEADCGDLVDIGGKTSRFWCPVCRKERYVPWSALRKRVVYEDKSTG